MNPQDVVRKEFREAFRGYNQADVDLFLDEVVDEMTRLVEENQRFKVRITALQQELARYRPGEPTQQVESQEARWRLKRFLEEQGRPLDEIEQMPKSPTVERISREFPESDEAEGVPEGAAAPRRDPVPRQERAPRQPPRQESRPPVDPPRRVVPKVELPPRPETDKKLDDPVTTDESSGKPWERDSKPFWAAE